MKKSFEPTIPSALHHVVLTPMFPPTRFGGIEKIVYHLVNEMQIAGEAVSVCTLHPERGFGIDSRHESSNAVVRVPCDGTDLHSILAAQVALAEAALTSIRASRLPPIIHVHDWFTAQAYELIKTQINSLGLAFFHGDKSAEYNGVLDSTRTEIHFRQKRLAQQADAIMCYSEFMRQSICTSLRIDNEKIGLFRCGIDTPPAKANREERRFNDPLKLLYRGRLASEKSVDILIQAVASLAQELDIHLTIRGDGPTRSKLECLASELNAIDCITFLPFSGDSRDLENDLDNCDAFVLPSRFEPFGLVVLEAIAREVPVIVADCGGPAEIVQNGVTGLTFEVGSVTKLRRCIENLYENPGLAKDRATSAKLDSLTRFNWKDAAHDVISTAYNCYNNGFQRQEAACG